MAEYMWAKIEIGGRISRLLLTHLVENFGVSPPLLAEAEPHGPEGASPGLPYHLVLEDMQAAWGQFEGLETYLKEQAIPFDLISDGKYEYSPELRKFRPSVTDAGGRVLQAEIDRTFLCDHDNRPMVPCLDIHQAMTETAAPQALAARLVELCGLDIPDLPPLQLAEAASAG